MGIHMDDPFGYERGPEPAGETGGDVEVSRLIEGYTAPGNVTWLTQDAIALDLEAKVKNGEITPQSALAVADYLRIFDN